MLLPGRHGEDRDAANDYRYSFQGQEHDDEVKGKGNSINYKYRMHDVRIGRFFAVDPLRGNYPELTPYQFSSNNTIWYVEIEGLEGEPGAERMIRQQISSKLAARDGGDAASIYHNLLVAESIDLEKIHVALDILGVIPVVGEIADGINGLIYSFEGDEVNAAISFAAMVPLIGDGGKIAKYAVKYGDDVLSIAKNADELIAGGRLFNTARQAKYYMYNVQKFGKYAADLFADGFIKTHEAARKLSKVKPCGCFTEQTTVLTEEGYKFIEDIKVGDLVYAYNDSTGSYALKEVTYIFSKVWDEVYEIVIEEEVIRVTHEHPFFVEMGWVEAEDLSVGDSLTLYSGRKTPIISIKLREGDFTVYNLEVDGFHTYFVSNKNVLVHNGACDFITVNVKQIREFFSTEPFAQSDDAIEAISDRISAGDPTVWSDPIYTTKIDGKTYVLDGHHRLEALSKSNSPKSVNVVDLSEEKAKELFKSKVEDIKSGGFDTKIGEGE